MVKRDWFIGLLIALVFAVATLIDVPILQKLERLAYPTAYELRVAHS